MSDDTPTRPENSSGDLPTERFDAQAAASDDSTANPPQAENYDATRMFDAPVEYPTELLGARGPSIPASIAGRPLTQREQLDATEAAPKARGLLYTLIAISAALLIAIIVLLVIAFGPKDEQTVVLPTDSPTPSASATPSAEPDPEPSAVEPTTAPPPAAVGPQFDAFNAPTTAGCSDESSDVPLTFSWSSGNALKAYIGVATTNAKAAPYESDLPPVYTYSEITYNCNQASQVYTVTLEDGDGLLTHRTVTITRQ